MIFDIIRLRKLLNKGLRLTLKPNLLIKNTKCIPNCSPLFSIAYTVVFLLIVRALWPRAYAFFPLLLPFPVDYLLHLEQ